MSQPTPYTRQYDFPDGPQTFGSFGNGLENELNDIETTISETLANLKLIQKDDGGIYNGIVGLDALSTGVKTFLGSNVSSWAISTVNSGAWLTATAYTIGIIVVQSTNTYLCTVAHTSGTFATDLAAGKWVLLALGTPTPPDLSVTTAKIATGAVTTAKLAALAVDTAALAALSVTTAKIDTGAVTQAKIADNAVDLAQIAHHTIGEMYGYGTAGAPTIISAGTTRTVLVATTSAMPAFIKHGGDWGRLLGSATITSSAAISFDTSGGFPLYVIHASGLHMQTDNTSLLLTASTDGGSTYLAGSNYDYHVQGMTDASSSYVGAVSTGASSIPLCTNVGNAAGESMDVIIFVYRAADTTKYVNFSGHVTYRDTAGVIKGGSFIGGLVSANDVTNVKLASSSGNLDGGNVYIWGEGEG